MGATQMVAFNTSTGHYLRKHNNTWMPTTNPLEASGYPKREIRLAVSAAKKQYPGDWMIVRRQDALKLAQVRRQNPVAQEDSPVFPSILPEVEHPINVDIRNDCPSSEGSQQIQALVSRLEAATSVLRIQELTAQLSDCDKTISDIYHYIEANQLNAAKGYKAYRNLRKVLLRRRSVKNELHIINQFRRCKIPNSSQVENDSTLLWSPDIEEMMNR